MLDSLSPQRRRFVLGVVALGLAVVLAVAAVLVVRAVRRGSPADQATPGPVLLVPGYGGTGDSLQGLAGRLRSQGRQAFVVTTLGDTTGDLDTQADRLGRFAADVLRRTGAPSVDVVGYSAGGVVARIWVKDGSGARLARRVLTLGSPQHGTSVAALGAQLGGGCPTACEQLAPDSPLLSALNAGDETPAGPEWITLRSTADRVVTPVDSASLAGALNVVVQQVCPGATTGHQQLPNSPVTTALIDSALGAGAPTVPRGTSC